MQSQLKPLPAQRRLYEKYTRALVEGRDYESLSADVHVQYSWLLPWAEEAANMLELGAEKLCADGGCLDDCECDGCEMRRLASKLTGK